MKRLLPLVVAMCLGLMPLASQGAPRHYVVDVKVLPPVQGGDYYIELLTLLLNASKSPGEVIDLRYSDHQLSQARWVAEVQQDAGNNVLWTVTNREREAVLRPIRVPLFKGLLGYRQLVIRKEDADKFAPIRTRADLAHLLAGQGAHWPDTDILTANHLPVVLGMAKENLYKMLVAKRFDYFPRGLTEVVLESDLIQQNNLMLEPHLLLTYPTAMYFFVNKNNVDLAHRLEKGWDIVLNNGEFDRLFYNLPRVKAALAELQSHSHRVIALDNPFLPEATPLQDSRLWIGNVRELSLANNRK